VADGTKHLLAVVDGARDFLEPLGGRLWVLAIYLANPLGLRKHPGKEFSVVTLVQEPERRFTAEEYEEMEKGLFDHLLALRSSGRSDFRETGKGQYVFRNLFFRASGLRTGWNSFSPAGMDINGDLQSVKKREAILRVFRLARVVIAQGQGMVERLTEVAPECGT
jgi:hypothetical protein